LDAQLASSILSACGESKDLKCGKEVHQAIVKHGLQSKANQDGLILSSALINMYAKSGSLEDAQMLSLVHLERRRGRKGRQKKL
jgi:hypothetical protein